MGAAYNGPVFSIVAFTGTGELMVDVKPDTHLIYSKKLVPTILTYSTIVMSSTLVQNVVQQLRAVHIADRSKRTTHVKTIQSTLATERNAVKQGVCPKCGGALVHRSGKYGAFQGCSNFPKCRFKAKI